MTIGIDWDEEEAAQKAPTVQQKTVQEPIGQGIPAVLKDTTPSSAVGLASVPPSVSTPVATGNPMVNQAAQTGGSMLQSLIPLINPIHLKQGVSEYVDSSSLDPYATAAHVGADVLGGYLGLKTVQGIGSGISKKIGNVIGGVDPTIQAQINQSNKQAERAARAPQGKTPDPLPTAGGRIEPTLSIEPPPPPAPPTTPPPPVTPVEKAAAAVETPMDAVKLREATAKADLAELKLTSARQATPDFEAKRLQAANAAQQSMRPVVPSTEVTPTFESRRQQALQAARQSMGDFPASVPPSSVPPSAVTQVKTLTVPEVTPEIAPEASTPKPIQRNAPPVSLQDSTGRQMPGAVGSAAAPKTVVTGEAGASVAPTEAAIEKSKTPRAERGSLATIANNPPVIEGQPGMREQYTVPKTKGSTAINPLTGEKFMGPGGYNYLAGQLGPERVQQAWEEQYGKRNVPAQEVIQKYSESRYPPTAATIEGKSGGAFTKPKLIPEYIKGSASPGALATTAVLAALPALGAAAYQKYKGNESAVDASLKEAKESLKSLATLPYDVSKAALQGDFGPFKDLMMSMNPASLLWNEMNKHDEEILKKMIYKEKVGAGRGMQGVPPPNK